MSDTPTEHIAGTMHDERVLARIRGTDLVVAQIGHWPDFHDFEVLSITLDRSPCRMGTAGDLRATFYIYDIRHAPSTPERRPAHAEVLFHNVDEVKIDGFNHQNPIMGLGLQLAYCQRLQTERIVVQWGGAGPRHEVQFRCDRITVVRVIDLDPLRRGAAEEAPHLEQEPDADR